MVVLTEVRYEQVFRSLAVDMEVWILKECLFLVENLHRYMFPYYCIGGLLYLYVFPQWIQARHLIN